MILGPPISKCTYTLSPYTSLFRSVPAVAVCRIPAGDEQGGQHRGAGGGVRMLGTGGRVVGAHQLVLQPRVLADRRPHQEDFDMTDPQLDRAFAELRKVSQASLFLMLVEIGRAHV